MLPWATTASSCSAATSPLLHSSPLPALPCAAPRSYHPQPHVPPPLSIGSRAPPRALSRGGDAFWEEPDDGSGSEYEDEGKQSTRQRSSPFPSPMPFSRVAVARQQDREEHELRRGTIAIGANLLLQQFFDVPISYTLHSPVIVLFMLLNSDFGTFFWTVHLIVPLFCCFRNRASPIAGRRGYPGSERDR
jgi:hypothetical protein